MSLGASRGISKFRHGGREGSKEGRKEGIEIVCMRNVTWQRGAERLRDGERKGRTDEGKDAEEGKREGTEEDGRLDERVEGREGRKR